MKVQTVLSLAAIAVGVIAEPVIVGRGTPVVRDVPAITNVLNSVGSGISTLDTAVKSFSGDSSDVDSKASDLISTIKSQAATVPSSGALTVNDALTLSGPVQALQAQGQTLVSDMIAKKSAVEGAGKCSDFRSITSDIQSASKGLIDAIVALVPTNVQTVADSLAAPFNAALAEGVAAYASGNCTDSSSSSGSASSSASATGSTTSSGSTNTSSGSATVASTVTETSSVTSGTSSGSQTGTTTSSQASSTEATVKTTKTSAASSSATSSAPSTSSSAATAAANVNYIGSSFGVFALAAAALAL